MVRVERREHRQQRVRGAGASTIQASFDFALDAPDVTQASLSPQRSGRRSHRRPNSAVAVTTDVQTNSGPKQIFVPLTTVGDNTGASNEEREVHGELAPDEPTRESTPRPLAKRTIMKPVEHTRLSNDETPYQPRNLVKKKLTISVMRMKGYDIGGITVADTTRTILEETIDAHLGRMTQEMQTLPDSPRQKQMRRKINLTLAFKESLNEKLLDLQDANDLWTANSKKTKVFRRNNKKLRMEILALQKSRQEIALEHDDVQAGFEGEKTRVEFKKTLSNNLFDIEAAIQNGRKRAKRKSREDEGPDVPLSMLLETVSKDVGSIGGGLLANIKEFNSTLENAAGWLEGGA